MILWNLSVPLGEKVVPGLNENPTLYSAPAAASAVSGDLAAYFEGLETRS